MQHLSLLRTRGLRNLSRFHLLHGAIGYLMSPIWFALLVMWALIGRGEEASVLTYFSEANPLFPTWPEMSEGKHALIIGVMYATLLAPKLLGVIALRLTGAQFSDFGGPLRFGGGFVVEIILSILYAPILMVQQMVAVFRVMFGLQKGWNAPVRCGGRYSLTTLVRCHAVELVSGTALMAGIVTGLVSLWLLPIALSLSLAIPLSAVSGRPVRGLIPTPEDHTAPQIVLAARHYRAQLEALGQSADRNLSPAE
jgi:membrane glycosyltransferase